ncbi:MAG: chemotaxis protein CheA [Phenylobacterium sp.]|uniref:chemotaxis protein CheA n=1 Tax=Phenylobacterium sp. TaxID=1871053 RepID=UPI00391B26E8
MSHQEARAAFMAEAHDLLGKVEEGLLSLSTRPDARDLVDEVFRGLHTLKGSGAMFGFDHLAAFAHHCESAFDRVRKGEAAATAELISASLSANDHLRRLLEHPGDPAAVEGRRLLDALEAALGAAMQAPSAAPSTPARPARWRVRFSLPPNALVNGANPLALLAELRELGTAEVTADTSMVPPLDELDAARCHVAWDVVLETDQPRSAIEDVFVFMIDDMQLQIEALDEAREPEPEPQAEPASSAAPAAGPVAEAGPAAAAVDTVRVPAERLDELMDRVGELVIAQSRLSQLAAASEDLALRAVAEEIERLSGELRDTTMVLRMVPVGALFGRFRRLVHDLARETGKSISLTTEGESTEVDKTVMERLADPLVHLIRNSADHGLETPAERRAAGKPEAGRLSLSARQAGGEVVISIRDDGRGVDLERVRARAEAQGLLEPGAAIADAELLQMIFHPGFSTAAAVTSLSGRGVGMDVVKRTVEALRGSIDIVSRPGEGAEISLRIPLTLAIIDGLLVRVGQGRYVVPLAAVEECLELPLDEDMRHRGRSLISLRDALVPYLRLRDVFETGTPPELHQKVVVATTGEERVGLVVDQVIGDHQTVIKSLSKLHDDVSAFSGATILGDGGVALILDVPHLVAAGQRLEAQLRAAG